MKRFLSISNLIVLSLLALASASALSAQTLVIDKQNLVFNGQVGGSPVSQTINVTSSNGSAQPFTLSYPSYPWLKANGSLFGFAGTTPASVTITADPAGLSAGPISASIVVNGGSAASNPPITVTFNISAIGVTPNPAAFTYTVGSPSFPAIQNLSITGATTACNATVAYGSGINWFNLLSTSCASPGTLTVVPNTGVIGGLLPGSYSGTVTIAPTPAGQNPPVVVNLTLTVSPTPPVTVNPATLVFNWQIGLSPTPVNPSQTLTISTPSDHPINFQFTSSGFDAGVNNWISVINPLNGTFSAATGPVPITITANPAGLAAGPNGTVKTYNATLTLSSLGATPDHTDIPVKLNVSATPLLNVPTATLNFAYQLGTAVPAAQNVNITATNSAAGVTPLTYAVNQSPNSPWLLVANSGSTAAPLIIAVNPAGLTTGTYNAMVNVTAANSTTPQAIPVVLKVTNDPTISTSVSQLSFPYQIGQTVPASQIVKVTSSTGVPLNYSAALSTTSCGSSWLLLNGTTNTVSGSTDDTLNVSVATAGVAAGTCTGKLTITATNPATGGAAVVNSPITVDVTLYVSSSALLVITPSTPPVFTVGVGGQTVQQSITLTSTNSDVLNYSVAFQSNNGGSWLFVTPQTGSTAVNNVLTVGVIPTGLAAGSYSGTITITATGPGGATVANSPVTIPVTLNVTAGSLTLSATDLSFPWTIGGAAPPAQNVTIGSTGQSLNYTAVANSNSSVNWLSVSPSSGNTASSGVLAISVDGSRLTPGVTYNGTVVVSSPGAGNSPATINVKLTVSPGTISAPTTTLTFIQVQGGAAPAAQTIAVTGTPAALNFTTTAATQNGGPWLSATPAGGSTPGSVQVQVVNSSTLAIGQYTGTVTIASTGAVGSPITVPVVLNVVSSAVLVAAPTSLSFTYISGLATPPAQTVSVTATGSNTTVPFTVQVQNDGNAGQWLVVNSSSSSTPSNLTVSVSPSTLGPGTYTGKLLITSPSSIATLTVPVTLTVTSIPKPVVVAVKNAASYASGIISPGENIVIGGTGLGPATLASAAPANGAFPTTLSNVRVLFDNVAAPIIYVSDTVTSVMVPYGVRGRTSTNIVVEYFGVQSAPAQYTVAAAVPGIYTQNASGSGPGAILNQNNSINGNSAPEKRGNVIAIYMTGEGETTPQGVDGLVIPAVASALKKPLLPVTVTVGGVDAHVEYAGSAPGLISGVMQVNVTIPLNAPTGIQPVVVTVGNAQSQFGSSAATVVIN